MNSKVNYEEEKKSGHIKYYILSIGLAEKKKSNKKITSTGLKKSPELYVDSN